MKPALMPNDEQRQLLDKYCVTCHDELSSSIILSGRKSQVSGHLECYVNCGSGESEPRARPGSNTVARQGDCAQRVLLSCDMDCDVTLSKDGHRLTAMVVDDGSADTRKSLNRLIVIAMSGTGSIIMTATVHREGCWFAFSVL